MVTEGRKGEKERRDGQYLSLGSKVTLTRAKYVGGGRRGGHARREKEKNRACGKEEKGH